MFSEKMLALGQKRSVIREIFEYGNRRRAQIGAENVFDFSLGNPAVPTPQAVTAILKDLLETDPAALHAYTSAPGALPVRQAIADDLNRRFDAGFVKDLIYMTVGAAASLTVTLTALVEEGDEVIVFAPYFPEYRVFVEQTGAKLVVVPCTPDTFQIDKQALEQALSPRTKAVIINSPNNPTGAVLTEKSLQTLADALAAQSEANDRPVFLLSDEPYRELVYDDVNVPFVPHFYQNTVVCYSYSKSLSLPGERIGYIAIAPQATDAADLFDAVCGAGRALGFVCAPALFQQVAAKAGGLVSDLSVYDRNRTALYEALTAYGFTAVKPDGAFYLFVKSPIEDAVAFCERAKDFELLLVPSDDFGVTGWVRIAYCVSEKTVQNALPAFKQLAKAYGLKGM